MKKTQINSPQNISHIECDLDSGLSISDVQSRTDAGLVNKITKRVTKTYLRIFYDNIFNIFNILLFAIAILMVIARLPLKTFLFLLITFANILIGLVQDIHARRLVDKLKVTSYPTVNVLRDKQITKIESNQLVLSDIVILKTGDVVPTDATIMEGQIELNESMLTGEANNIAKGVGQSIFSGSFVTSGTAKVRVEKLGRENYAEKLQDKAKEFKKRKSEILNSLDKIFKVIGFIVIFFALVLVIIYIVNGQLTNPDTFSQTVLSLSGSLVSMIPNGMYLLTSVTLATGVISLARKRMLVQQMYCIEMLARVDIVCFDKTGTITDGTMIVNDIISNENKNEIKSILKSLVDATKDTNATANAITNFTKDFNSLSYHSGLPFNSERKYSAVMLNDGRSYVLGAREFIHHNDEDIDKKCIEYEKKGFRVLVLGLYKQVIDVNTKLKDVDIKAIIVLEDHIKDDAAANIKWFKDNNVQSIVISGDNPISVSVIAKKVGVENADKYISLEGMSIEEVKKIASEYTVFGRVSPEQKEAIVSSLQNNGHVVAMTGDGVNDILALKVADCSIAMSSGSDAAKNTAQIVALDNDFSSLPDVVKEGRRVINNLQRTCSLFLVKTLFAIVLSLFFMITSLINKDLVFPFQTAHLYVWEFCTIGVASFFLSFQPNHEKLKKSTFLVNILTRTIPAGIVQILIVIVFFILGVTGVLDYQVAITMAVITFSISSFVVLIRICMPLDIYRGVLIVGLGIVCALMFILDSLIIINGTSILLNLDYSLINSSNWWIILVAVFISVPLYIGFETISVRIHDKYFLPKEEQGLVL